MAIRRGDGIDAAEADQLLAGRSAGAARAGLSALLAEASGAPRPEELAGEAAAVAAYRRVRAAVPSRTQRPLAAVSTVDGSTVEGSTADPSTVDAFARHRRYAPSLMRGAVLRLAMVAVMLTAAGTVAVRLAYRPARVTPGPGEVPSSSPTPSPSPSSPLAGNAPGTQPGSRSSSGEPSAGRPGGSGTPAIAAPVDPSSARALCGVWMSVDSDQATRDWAVAQLRRLMADMDGPNGVPAFCRKLLGDGSSGSATASARQSRAAAATDAPSVDAAVLVASTTSTPNAKNRHAARAKQPAAKPTAKPTVADQPEAGKKNG